MDPLAVLTNLKKKNRSVAKAGVRQLRRNSKIIKTILTAIQEKKGQNIVSLDLRKINEAVADFFIICEATSQPQIRAITEHVEKQTKEKCNENPYHIEGYKNLQWVLIDYINVVVHIMLPEIRRFYRLEEMWCDAVSEYHDK